MFDPNLITIANQLVENCRNGTEMEGLDQLYDQNAVSIEAAAMPDGPGAETKGLDGIRGKHEWWNNAHENHGLKVDGPYFHGSDRFSVIFNMDVTNHESKERMQMQEVAIYTVGNGKIVREEFFYGMPEAPQA